MFHTPQNVEELRNVRHMVRRARLYRSAGYADSTSHELSLAADRCYRLLKKYGMCSVIEDESDIMMFVLDLAEFGHPVSMMRDAIASFLGDESHDFGLLLITVLLGQIELENGSNITVGDISSYALLGSARLYGLEHKLTFKLLHGLGWALQKRSLLQRAETAFRLAFEGYMRTDYLT